MAGCVASSPPGAGVMAGSADAGGAACTSAAVPATAGRPGKAENKAFANCASVCASGSPKAAGFSATTGAPPNSPCAPGTPKPAEVTGLLVLMVVAHIDTFKYA